MRWKFALGSAALDLDGDARVLCLEKLGDPLGNLDLDGGVVVDLALLLGGLDQSWRDLHVRAGIARQTRAASRRRCRRQPPLPP